MKQGRLCSMSESKTVVFCWGGGGAGLDAYFKCDVFVLKRVPYSLPQKDNFFQKLTVAMKEDSKCRLFMVYVTILTW
jgi:hypothetical protein